MRLHDVAVMERWAMDESVLRTVLEITARENDSVEAVEAKRGKPLDNTHAVSYRDTPDGRKLAIIPVIGPIARRANLFSEISGATSIEILARDFQSALNNPTVKGVVFDIDSPGGTVNGLNELAAMVREARGPKPIVAYVGHLAASAAYWLASAADEIVAERTASVGSIGVVAVVPDPTKKQSKDLEIVSSQSPNKRPDLATDQGRSVIQQEVDALAEIFIETVASNRGVTPDHVMSSEGFGAGGMRLARDAERVHMIDRIGSFEKLISEMSDPNYTKAKQEKRMSESFMQKIASKLGIQPRAEAKPEEGEVVAALEESLAKNEELAAKVAEYEAKVAEQEAARAEAEKQANEEIAKTIEAQVEAEAQKYAPRLGKEASDNFRALLREAKVVGASEVESGLLAFVASLPVIGSTERHVPADIDTEAVAAKVAGESKPDDALNASIEATLDAKGLKRHTPQWASEFQVEFRRATSK